MKRAHRFPLDARRQNGCRELQLSASVKLGLEKRSARERISSTESFMRLAGPMHSQAHRPALVTNPGALEFLIDAHSRRCAQTPAPYSLTSMTSAPCTRCDAQLYDLSSWPPSRRQSDLGQVGPSSVRHAAPGARAILTEMPRLRGHLRSEHRKSGCSPPCGRLLNARFVET